MKKGLPLTRQTLIWVLSLLVVISMICSFLFTLRPPRAPAAPTAIPTQSLSR
ncbi:MAG: hypothetical protein JXA74_08925 [Anaerolineae bacterium]|nr:hypothetical protein [Anaerolineae bacterium]